MLKGQRTSKWCQKFHPTQKRFQQITNSIATFITKDLRPYLVVENQGFSAMLHTEIRRRLLSPLNRNRIVRSLEIPTLNEKSKLQRKVAKETKESCYSKLIKEVVFSCSVLTTVQRWSGEVLRWWEDWVQSHRLFSGSLTMSQPKGLCKNPPTTSNVPH